MSYKRKPPKERVITAIHAPGSTISYVLDFTDILDQYDPVDIVTGAAATASGITGGVTVVGTTYTNKTVSVNVSGGTALGALDWITVSVNTAGGSLHVWTLRLHINHQLVQPNEQDEFEWEDAEPIPF